MQRKICTAPFRLSWFHFETTKTIEEIDAVIIKALEGIQYKTSPLIAAYFADDFDVHIYRSHYNDSFIVDCSRTTNNNCFQYIDRFERMRCILNDEEYIPIDQDPDPQGKSLDDMSYDDLLTC
jgi:hypothetical protein